MKELWTIGHSTRSLEEFLALLEAHQIRCLVDVRTFPSSRRYPHFNQAPLSEALKRAGLDYQHLPGLGGRRPTRADSPNTNWRNASFRGYADHMASAEYQHALEQLVALAESRRTAILCAEVVWWRCHRSLIADHLKAEGWRVWHILDADKADEHPFTAAARIVGGRLSYAPEESPELNWRS